MTAAERMKKRLSQRAITVIEDFDAAAKRHGYMEDEGTAAQSQKSGFEHEAALNKLMSYVLKLEVINVKLTKELARKQAQTDTPTPKA